MASLLLFVELIFVVIEVAIDDKLGQLLGDAIDGVLTPRGAFLFAMQLLFVFGKLSKESQVWSDHASCRLRVCECPLQCA